MWRAVVRTLLDLVSAAKTLVQFIVNKVVSVKAKEEGEGEEPFAPSPL